jgi:hypothetical protein
VILSFCGTLPPRTLRTRSSWRRCSPNQRAGTDRRRRGLQFATARTKEFAVARLVAGETTHLVLALGATVGGGKTSGTLSLGLANEAEETGLLLPEASAWRRPSHSVVASDKVTAMPRAALPRDNQPRPLTPGRRHNARRRSNVSTESPLEAAKRFVGPQPHCIRPHRQHLQRRSWWQLMASRGTNSSPSSSSSPSPRAVHEKSRGAAKRGDEVGAAGGNGKGIGKVEKRVNYTLYPIVAHL